MSGCECGSRECEDAEQKEESKYLEWLKMSQGVAREGQKSISRHLVPLLDTANHADTQD